METKIRKNTSQFVKISHNAKEIGKVVSFLTREQMDFIDKLSKDAWYSTGKKISRAAVIQALVEAARKIDLAGNNINSQAELEERMAEVAKTTLASCVKDLRKGLIK